MAFPTGWLRACALVIDHTKVSASQSNFPALVAYNTTADNATNLPTEMLVSGGGNAALSDGADIRFSSDSAGSNPLHYEIVVWTQHASTDASRHAEIWVACNPSSSVDTTIYVWYSNASATAPSASDSTFGSQGVWDSNFKFVGHYGDGTTLSVADSTVNAFNGTNSSATAGAGNMGGGAVFNGGANIKVGSSGTLTAPFTIQEWVKPDGLGFNEGIFGSRSPSDASFDAKLRLGNGVFGDAGTGSTWLDFSLNATFSYSAGVWLHITYAVDTTGWEIFVNGASANSGSLSGTVLLYDTNHELRIGAVSSSSEFLTGTVDETRVSNIVRSASWLATSYNNESSPSTFWTVGTPFTPGGGGGGTTYTYTPSGGITYSGAAAVSKSRIYNPSGGIVFAGAASTSNGANHTYSPTGGIVFAGTSLPAIRGKSYYSSGGISFTGSAALMKSKVYTPSGGISFRGAAITSGSNVTGLVQNFIETMTLNQVTQIALFVGMKTNGEFVVVM